MLGEKDEANLKLWFTRKGHHRNASIIYIIQNMFQQSKSSRTISFNSDTNLKLWFTRKGHHRNASVIYIIQNIFQQSKSSRTISLNSDT